MPPMAVAVVAGALARLHAVPVHIAAPPAMFRAGFITQLTTQFSRDTGLPVVVDPIRADQLSNRLPNGDFDIVFAHESQSMSALQRLAVRSRSALRTTFILVGPRDDPADVRHAASATDAFWQISSAQVPFQPAPLHSAASAKEGELWTKAAVEPPKIAPPSSFEAALDAATRTNSYLMMDKPSFQRLMSRTNLIVLFQSDPVMADVYTVAELPRGGVHPHCGKSFWRWFHSPQGEAAVRMSAINGPHGYVLTP